MTTTAKGTTDLLTLTGLHAGYGGTPILKGVDLHLAEREIVLLIGHNGAGKSTVLKSVLGFARHLDGDVRLSALGSLLGLDVARRIKGGLAYVPQSLGVFPRFTVRHCLELGGYTLGGRRAVRRRCAEVLDLLPMLKEHQHVPTGLLSGGEQRMVMLGMALMPRPGVLLVDEPSAGLAPARVREVMDHLRSLVDTTGIGVLLVEQNVTAGLTIADRLYVLREGRVVGEFTPRQLADREGFWDLL